MTGVRSLPIRVVPLPGEAIDSWLEAIAHRTGTPFVDLDTALRPDDSTAAGRVRRPNLWPMHLRPNEMDTIAAAADLPATVVEAMTLARYDGVALSLNGRKGRAAAGLPWGRGRRSRYCPDCLADSGGRWQLQWRLGCVFACTEHHCLLADTCPRCESFQRCRRPLREVVPSPGGCAHRSADTARPRGLTRCGGDLTSAPVMRLRPDHPAIRAQQRVLDVLAAGRGTFGVYADRPFGARVVLADLHAISSRVLVYGSIEEIAERVPADLADTLTRIRSAPAPEAPALRRSELSGASGAIATAVAVTTAMTVLDRPDIAGAGEALRWLVHGGRRLGLPVDAGTMCDWGSATSTTLAAIQLAALRPLFVRAVDQLRYRSAAALPSYPSTSAVAVDAAARRIPTLLWPEWSLRFTVAPCSPAQVRPALSVALMLVGTAGRLGEAADRLGSAVRADGVTRTLACLRNSPRWDDSLIALTRLADHLAAEPPPIDYDRRRQLDYRALLPDERWHKICRRTGIAPGAGQKADFARCLLFERLSGLPASRSPFLAPADYDVRAKRAQFPRTLTPALAELLDEAARRFLDDHGLGEEPVYWHPPPDLLDGLDLPGPDPGTVDLAALHDLARERTALSEIARQLGSTLDVIRYLLEKHPAPALPMATERFEQRAARSAAEEAVSRTQFVDLYCIQRRTLAEIGAMIGVSRKSAGRLARHHGITPTVGGPPVDPAWFHDQYVTQRRTLRDLGHEVGLSVPRMSRIAKDYGIPIRPPSEAIRTGDAARR